MAQSEMVEACYECAAVLTAEERHYYAGRCEGCERAWHDRIEAWRKGGPDAEMDAMFDNRPTLQ